MPCVHLEELTPDNWRTKLRVREEQKYYVFDVSGILARAYAYRESRSRVRLIYADDEPVGVLLYYDLESLGSYDLSQFFMDCRFQGRGYGELAARLALEDMRGDGRCPGVDLCYIEGDEAARRLYEKPGFRPTGVVDGDEVILHLDL